MRLNLECLLQTHISFQRVIYRVQNIVSESILKVTFLLFWCLPSDKRCLDFSFIFLYVKLITPSYSPDTHYHPLILRHSLSYTHSFSRHSLSHTHSFSRHSLSHSQILTITHLLTPRHSLSHTHSFSRHSLSHTDSFSDTHCHTPTHFQTLTITHPLIFLTFTITHPLILQTLTI